MRWGGRGGGGPYIDEKEGRLVVVDLDGKRAAAACGGARRNQGD